MRLFTRERCARRESGANRAYYAQAWNARELLDTVYVALVCTYIPRELHRQRKLACPRQSQECYVYPSVHNRNNSEKKLHHLSAYSLISIKIIYVLKKQVSSLQNRFEPVHCYSLPSCFSFLVLSRYFIVPLITRIGSYGYS